MSLPRLLFCSLVLIGWSDRQACAKIGGWDTAPNTQYHIQTDEGPERFFRYQTISGQYRKEKRLQDGSVVGTYGWVDANGYLRLRDYIADDKGYRIVRTKMVRVGQEPSTTTTTTPRPPPIALSDYLKEKQSEDYRPSSVEIVPNGYPSSTISPVNTYIQPTTYRPYLYNLNSLDQKPYESQQQLVQQQVLAVQQQVQAAQQQQFQGNQQQQFQDVQQQQLQTARQQVQPPQQQEVPYDGVSFTQNGFRYYLPRHYHEEETAGDRRAGSFGYIDPFGIRRVIYYNTDPSSGFVHRKNNRYVGFNATPYDPRY
ncbi:ataxin-2 homolog [Halyomorpha halys]|uniref:ataxin-2 homolog n=1 Tax=Halyomorpha halys TaxID=286706 RepID=UPI0006D50617|nr:uncharacterized protein LOC106687060 [Halyomorpha halys]